LSQPVTAVRLAGVLTILVGAALGWAETSGQRLCDALLAGTVAVTVLVALPLWLVLAIQRRRARRALAAGPRAPAPELAVPVDRRAASGTVLGLVGVALALLGLQWLLGVDFWALLLLSAGGLLVWSQAVGAELAQPTGRPPSGWERLLGVPRMLGRRPGADGGRDALVLAAGIALVVLGALALLSSQGALAWSRSSLLQTVVVLVALTVVVAPFWRRLSRRATAERNERIRSDERAEVAAHLHDSVLQTLALIQRRSDDPREVSRLARGQERELRLWLSGRSERPDDETMAALRAAAAAVELEHGVEVDVVTTGERALDDRSAALVAAAREAIANAARHAGTDAQGMPQAVQVFAEVTGDRLEVFVRDRGRGFDPDAVPADRRGVRESIVGRLRRAGGRATIHSAPGQGTEVELSLPLDA
jgi:signal transduction histidine kinase